MTYNQIISLFRGIVTASKYLQTFGTGELWEMEGIIKPGIKYPLLWCQPITSVVEQQRKIITFRFLCMDIVNKDKTNEQEVLSDTMLGIEDLIKVLRMESDNYTLITDPTLEPFIEEFADWCAGWRTDLQIEFDFNSNDCDTSFDNLGVSILDINGNVLRILSIGDTYTVDSLQEIIDTITGNSDITIIDPLS